MRVKRILSLEDGLEEYEARGLWENIEKFASYAFCAAHSCAYSLLSYQIMWLKTYYTVEFFAAAFSLLKTDKLAELIKDAKDFDIEIVPPDVQWSTDQFEVLTDTKLLIPFGRVKGIGDITTQAIIAARKDGKFKSVEDFLLRVQKNKCNKRHVDLLQKVGAFATVDPEFDSIDNEDRLYHQYELLENLMTHLVPVDKVINQTAVKNTLLPILKAHSERVSCDYNEKFVMPLLGSSAKFMAIFDAPGKRDEKVGGLLREKNEYVTTALTEAGLFLKNGYWTSMIKSVRAAGKITGRDQERDMPLLDEEIKIVNAPLILLLGTGVLRYFIPSIKERALDIAGRVVFDSSRNVNFLCGFNPNEVYFDSARQQVLNDVFARIPDLLA